MNLNGVYLILGEADLTRHGLVNLLDQASRAGVSFVQLREKLLSDRDLYTLAKAVASELVPRDIPLIINDRVDIARASGAQGVHLGFDDLPPEVARDILGPDALIGLTVHSLNELTAAKDMPVDYYGVGPAYASPTKTNLPTWGLAALSNVVLRSNKPVFAIGGIGINNVDEVLSTGVDGVCVVSSVCHAADPYQAARNLVERFSANKGNIE